MTIQDLIDVIERGKKEYGEEFSNWDVYSEQCDEADIAYKREHNWKSIKDDEDWEYFKCVGFNTRFPKEKIFTININY